MKKKGLLTLVLAAVLGIAMMTYFVIRVLLYYPREYPMCYEPENLFHVLGIY